MVRLCGNHDDAEDSLVDALVSAFQASSKLRDDDAFKAWLSIIAKRSCLRMRKKESLLRLVPLTETVVAIHGEEENAESGQIFLRDCIKASITRLPSLYGEIYNLCEIEEMDVKEAAHKLGLTLPAAKSRLRRARTRARQEFDRALCVS